MILSSLEPNVRVADTRVFQPLTNYRAALAFVALAASMAAPAGYAQSVESTVAAPLAASATIVPNVIRFSGTLTDGHGYPITTPIDATFSLYAQPASVERTGGNSPLWQEKQIITPNEKGAYTVYLGVATARGLPAEIFTSVTAQFVGVKLDGEKELARVPLVSVPYALKAADAQTLGGLPASAFVLAGSQIASLAAAGAVSVSPDVSGVTTTGGTNHYLPKFSGASTVVNSQLYDNGTNVGIGVIPNSSVKLDVGGAMIMRGNMIVSRVGNATSANGYPSYGFGFYSNVYNSSTHGTDNPHFILQSEPIGNNTTNTSANFNLLYSNHGTAPVETGFYINPSGVIHFASGQTFKGAATTGVGLEGTSSGTDGYGIEGVSTGNGAVGVYGNSTGSADASNNYPIGVLGHSTNGFGVEGITDTATDNFAAVLGLNGGGSATYSYLKGFDDVSAGVWGDTKPSSSASYPIGVIGTADSSYAGYFNNNSDFYPSILAENQSSGGTGLFKTFMATSPQGTCGIAGGSMTCTGQVKSLATTGSNLHQVETYAVQSPENWMEDFGTGQLHGGAGVVKLDTVFAETVSRSSDYHVFLTPRGDSKGLYVTNLTPTSFEVRESSGGTASVSFDYRIVAKRRGLEAQRLTDVTEKLKTEMQASKLQKPTGSK